jgi:phage baseplate assembly protein W
MPGYSPKYPLTFNASDGYYQMNKTLRDAIRQNVKMLVLTIPGERIMDPAYGVGIKKYLFEFTQQVVGDLETEIRYQFGRYLPQIALENVLVLTNDDDPEIDPNGLYVRISYYIPSIGLRDSLEIEEVVN